MTNTGFNPRDEIAQWLRTHGVSKHALHLESRVGYAHLHEFLRGRKGMGTDVLNRVYAAMDRIEERKNQEKSDEPVDES